MLDVGQKESVLLGKRMAGEQNQSAFKCSGTN